MANESTAIWDRVRVAPDHTGTSFEAHLLGTASILRAWGQRSCLERAGRYHAVCGNPRGRPSICPIDSPELCEEIGDEAARLVFLWAQVDRASLACAVRSYQAGSDPLLLSTPEGEALPITRQAFLDLAHLYAANEVEVLPRRPSRRIAEAVWGLRPVLCPAAVAQLGGFRSPREKSRWGRLLRRLTKASAR